MAIVCSVVREASQERGYLNKRPKGNAGVGYADRYLDIELPALRKEHDLCVSGGSGSDGGGGGGE